MARPKTKKELLTQAQTEYDKLETIIAGLSEAELTGTFPFADRDHNIRDVIIHLHEWQNMMNIWYQDGMSGKMTVTPAPGFTWRTTPELNQQIWLQYQDVDIQQALKLLKQTHAEMIELINQHTESELFEKTYTWTKTTTLGAYLISATSSHYAWALKKIRKYVKAIK